MMMPMSRPTTTEQLMSAQLSMSSSHMMTNVATTMRAELRLVPTDSEPSRSLMVAFSLVRTAKMPMMESRMPTAAISIGAMTALNCMAVSPEWRNAAAPSAAVERMEPQ